jgi:hypothetical protein
MYSPPEVKDPTSSSPSSPEEDLPPYPWDLSDSDYEREMEKRWDAHERRWNAHIRGESSHVPVPAERELVSPFIVTSDEDSSEDEDEDPAFLPPSTPERSQLRTRKRDPSLPTSQNVVLSHPAPEPGLSYHEHIGQSKEAEVVRKDKGKME